MEATTARPPHAAPPAAYRLAWGALVFGLIGALWVLGASGLDVTTGPALRYAGVLVALALCHWLYTHRRPNPRLAVTTGAMVLMIGSALAAGVMANAGLRLRFPLIDAPLAAIDRAIGIDTPALVTAIAGQPWLGELLGVAYGSVFPLCFIAAVWLAVAGRTDRLWELVLGFGACIQIAAAASVLLPARCNIVHAGLAGLAGTSLPEGSGTYHLRAFATYRDGTAPVLDMQKLEGVVCFPSFHMVMAIIVAFAFRGTGALGWLIGGWCALIAVSTIPNGGHYVIDLIGGTLLWAAVIALSRLIDSRPAVRLPEPGLQTATA